MVSRGHFQEGGLCASLEWGGQGQLVAVPLLFLGCSWDVAMASGEL